MPAQTIVFDLDGTLIDTAPDLVDTLNLVFAREGLPQVAYETARNLIGGGARAMIARGIAAEGRILVPAKSSKCLRILSRMIPPILPTAAALPRLVDALDALASRGCRFAVCTNKLERLSVLLSNSLLPAPTSADKIRSACKSPIRRFCDAPSLRRADDSRTPP